MDIQYKFMTHKKAIGGVFIRSKDPEALKKWYNDILELNIDQYMASFIPVTKQDAEKEAYSVFGLFPDGTEYFEPSQENVMINFRVKGLPGLIEELKQKNVLVMGPEKFEQGLFAWVIDPERRKIELWEKY